MENQMYLPGIAPPLDEGEKEPVQEEEKAPEHLLVRILRNVIDQDDAVLLDFVDKVMPKMIEAFSLMTAKGGTDPKFSHLYDQSMLTHILNGMLPTLRILKTAASLGARPLKELEQKLYMISYSLHDLNKIVGEKELKRTSLDDEEYLGHVRTQMQRLGFDEFLSDYESYLNDITYLIQNTEEKWGANRNLANFGDFGIRPRRLLFLADACQFSDVLASAVHASSDALTHEKLKLLLSRLSDNRLCFTYHRITENRGLLTNMINNTLLRLMTEQGQIPLLFFPTGVTYLSEVGNIPQISMDEAVEVVCDGLVETCRKRLKIGLIGYTPSNKGRIINYADYYKLFFNRKELLQLGVQAALKFSKDASKIPETIKGKQKQNKLPADIVVEELVIDKRADVIAKYLDYVSKEDFFKNCDVNLELLKTIGLEDELPMIEKIYDYEKRGGTIYRWFYVAGKYLAQNPGLSEQGQDIEDLLKQITLQLWKLIKTDDSIASDDKFVSLKSYIESVIDINGQLKTDTQDFINELENYKRSKIAGRKGKLSCSICNADFDTSKQMESGVLFMQAVYSNKMPLMKGDPKRGICEICSIEMLLRQILMPDRFSSSGKDYENKRIRYLYFYPTYFFTPETAKLIGEIYRDLKQINYPQLSRSLLSDSLIYGDVRKWTALEEFMLEDKPDEEEKEESFLVKLQFPKHELATFYFVGIPPRDTKDSKKPTDTESWAMPTLMALLSSLALNVKTVVSESMIPLFASGDDFRETVFLDGPHSFVRHLLKNDRFRLDEVETAIRTIIGAYELQRKVHSERGRMKWNQINGIARNLDTDKLYVFHYLGVLGRKDKFKINRKNASEFMEIYRMIGGDKMAMIGGIVDRYCKFYKPSGYAAYARVRPFHLAANTIIKSDTAIELDDLKLEMVGEISGWLGRVRRPGTKGYAPLSGKEEIQSVRDFVEYVVHEVFLDYCKGERAILRKRINRLRAACEAYYLENYGYKKDEEENDAKNNQ